VGLVTEAWDFVRYAGVVRNVLEYATLPLDYVRSAQGSKADRIFEAVHGFVIFVGIGRSGTSLLGALLDAHPNMVIANQQGSLKYVYPVPFPRDRIFRLLLRNSVDSARGGRQGSGGYSFAVPDQWQGRFQRIEVIGDKSMSAQTVEWLHSKPWLLSRLASVTRAPVRLLHVVRNPFDTIARRSLRRRVSLEKISREYFELTDRLQFLIARLESDAGQNVRRIPVHLEDLIGDPAVQLASICAQLGVRSPNDYLRSCADIVYPKPAEPRKRVEWPAALVSEIEHKLADYPHLCRYTFQ